MINVQRTTLIIWGVGFASAGIGFVTGVGVTRDKLRKEYEESAASYRRAMERTKHVEAHAPVETEAELDLGRDEFTGLPVVGATFQAQHFDPEAAAYSPSVSNPYHVAVSAVETPVAVFVSGEPNDYGIAYIEEEEFMEEDGRFKGAITILMDAHNPTFFMNGELIDDWADRLGASIVKDFLTFIPHGTSNQVLYVRNTKTDEDYEVTPEMP